jgi:hypothetical protein
LAKKEPFPTTGLIAISALLIADMAFMFWVVGRNLDWDGKTTILGYARHGRG